MTYVMGFFAWYEKHVTESLAVTAIILYLQIPHTISAAECFFAEGSLGLYGFHPITDFLLWCRFTRIDSYSHNHFGSHY